MKPTRKEIEAWIEVMADIYGLSDKRLLAQCQAESGFDADALSSEGAIGLFQLMPATAAGLKIDPHDWKQNVEGGARYMVQMLKLFGMEYDKALAAYNWGPGHMKKLITASPIHWRVLLPAETKAYIQKVLA